MKVGSMTPFQTMMNEKEFTHAELIVIVVEITPKNAETNLPPYTTNSKCMTCFRLHLYPYNIFPGR